MILPTYHIILSYIIINISNEHNFQQNNEGFNNMTEKLNIYK